MGRKHEHCEPGKRGLSVKVDPHKFERALKVFKKKVMNDGILKEAKDRQHHEKRSDKKRRKRAEARRRWLKQLSLNKKFE